MNSYLVLFGILSIIAISSYVYGVSDLYSIWTFRIVDPPWLPPNFSVTSIMGGHTFGDFQLPYYLSKDATPYSWTFYNVTMPFGFFVYKVFTFFSIKTATFLFLVFSLIYAWDTGRRLLRSANVSNPGLFATIFLIFSLPTLINLDRGGGQLLAYSLFVHGIILIKFGDQVSLGLQKKKQYTFYSIALLSLAISLKIYLIIPLFLILGIFHLRKIFLIAAFTAFSNLLFSFFFGGPIVAAKGLYIAYLWQTGESDTGWIFGGVSLSKFFASTYFYTHTPAETELFAKSYQDFVFAPGVAYLLLIIFVIIRTGGQGSQAYRAGISLSTIFLVIPVSHSYTLVACSFIALFSICSYLQSKDPSMQWKSLALLTVASISLLPIPSFFYLTLIPGLWILNLIFILLFEIFMFCKSKTKKQILSQKLS